MALNVQDFECATTTKKDKLINDNKFTWCKPTNMLQNNTAYT